MEQAYWRQGQRFGLRSFEPIRLLENIQAVNYIETTVEWEQWAVADSDSE